MTCPDVDIGGGGAERHVGLEVVERVVGFVEEQVASGSVQVDLGVLMGVLVVVRGGVEFHEGVLEVVEFSEGDAFEIELDGLLGDAVFEGSVDVFEGLVVVLEVEVEKSTDEEEARVVLGDG